MSTSADTPHSVDRLSGSFLPISVAQRLPPTTVICLSVCHYAGKVTRLGLSFVIVWLALAAMDPADRDTRLSYSSATKLYRYCEILGSQKKMSEIPAARQAEIEDIVLEAFPKALLPSSVQPDVEMEIPSSTTTLPAVQTVFNVS
jgi:hypothetical protein